MDADIYGPSVPIMFGIRGQRPVMTNVEGKDMIVPIEKYGIKIMSIGLLVDEKSAVVWRGPMASSAIRQFVTDVHWEELDYLVIDMPPGTGDIHLTLVQTVPVTGAVIVTTPQEVALADAKKAIAMFGQAQIKVPIIGLVENMAWFTPAELPNNKYYIFGKEGGRKMADQYDIPFLGEIPLVQSIREGGDEGIPIMVSEDEISKKAFTEFAGNAVRSISMRNANMEATKVVEMLADLRQIDGLVITDYGLRIIYIIKLSHSICTFANFHICTLLMYSLPYFKESDFATVLQFMRQNPFVVLCGTDKNGLPVTTQVPVFVDERDGKIILSGHMMKNTDHQLAFAEQPDALAVFNGAHVMSARAWYSEPKTASTWNYMSVHARGKMVFL